MSGTSLSEKHQRQLATLHCNVVKGIPPMAEEQVKYWNMHIEELHEGLRSLLLPQRIKAEKSLVKEIMDAEERAHFLFFGRKFDLTKLLVAMRDYSEKIQEWQKLGLELHYLPSVLLDHPDNIPGWRIKPDKQFYWDWLKNRDFFRRSNVGEMELVEYPLLDDAVVLIDTRKKPRYQNNGNQMYDGDRKFLGNIISRLRR